MSPEINWSNNEIDHVTTISFLDVSGNEEVRKAFN